MKELEFKSLMRKYGFEFCRHSKSSHEIWKDKHGNVFVVPTGREIKHGIVWQFTRKYIKNNNQETAIPERQV